MLSQLLPLAEASYPSALRSIIPTAAQKLNSILVIPSGLAVVASFTEKRQKLEVKSIAGRKESYHLFQVA